MRSRTLKPAALGLLVAAALAAPAGAVPDEDAGPVAPAPAQVEAFDWADAGVGAGAGAVIAAAALGAAVAVRRHRGGIPARPTAS